MKDPDTSASNDDGADNGSSVGHAIATATVNGDDVNSDYGGSGRNTGTEVDSTNPSSGGHRTPSTQPLQASSSAPLSDPLRDDAASISFQEREEGEPSARAGKEAFGGSVGTTVVGGDSDEGHGSSNVANSSAMKRGDFMLWPSEPSESVKGEDYGDRYVGQTGFRRKCCSITPPTPRTPARGPRPIEEHGHPLSPSLLCAFCCVPEKQTPLPCGPLSTYLAT